MIVVSEVAKKGIAEANEDERDRDCDGQDQTLFSRVNKGHVHSDDGKQEGEANPGEYEEYHADFCLGVDFVGADRGFVGRRSAVIDADNTEDEADNGYGSEEAENNRRDGTLGITTNGVIAIPSVSKAYQGGVDETYTLDRRPKHRRIRGERPMETQMAAVVSTPLELFEIVSSWAQEPTIRMRDNMTR